MKDFYEKFCQVYPFEIKDWQSEGGKEFLGEFDKELKKDSVEHIFIYPRCPKKCIKRGRDLGGGAFPPPSP